MRNITQMLEGVTQVRDPQTLVLIVYCLVMSICLVQCNECKFFFLFLLLGDICTKYNKCNIPF